jgi:hypothetical protein
VVAHTEPQHADTCASRRWAYMVPHECDCGARSEPLVLLSDALAAIAKAGGAA